MCKIFLSYSRKDYDIVRNIKQEIEEATKARCWMDLDRISYESPDFTKIIAPAIEQASIFVFILTPNSQESKYARNELLLAKARSKHIFFVEPHECEMTSEFILEYGHYNRNLYYIDCQRQKLYKELSRLLDIFIVPLHLQNTNIGKEDANGQENAMVKKQLGELDESFDSRILLFPVDGIILGETPIDALKCNPSLREENDLFKLEEGKLLYSDETGLYYIQYYGMNYIARCIADCFAKFPLRWKDYFGFTMENSYREIKSIIYSKAFLHITETSIPNRDDYVKLVSFFTDDKKYFVALFFQDDYTNNQQILTLMTIETAKCPYCGSGFDSISFFFDPGYDISTIDNACIQHYCSSCGKFWYTWDLERDGGDEYGTLMCPDCHHFETMIISKDPLLFKCQHCKHIWELKSLK